MAIKSISAMRNIGEICSSLRERYYGSSASAKDYKDSFIVNNAIQIFPIDDCQALMDEVITALDKAEMKVSKSLNLRADCYIKVSDISEMLKIPEAEVIRRILYYSLMINDCSSMMPQQKMQLSLLKEKVVLLKAQFETSMATLNQIINEIAQLEVNETNENEKGGM